MHVMPWRAHAWQNYRMLFKRLNGGGNVYLGSPSVSLAAFDRED